MLVYFNAGAVMYRRFTCVSTVEFVRLELSLRQSKLIYPLTSAKLLNHLGNLKAFVSFSAVLGNHMRLNLCQFGFGRGRHSFFPVEFVFA